MDCLHFSSFCISVWFSTHLDSNAAAIKSYYNFGYRNKKSPCLHHIQTIHSSTHQYQDQPHQTNKFNPFVSVVFNANPSDRITATYVTLAYRSMITIVPGLIIVLENITLAGSLCSLSCFSWSLIGSLSSAFISLCILLMIKTTKFKYLISVLLSQTTQRSCTYMWSLPC